MSYIVPANNAVDFELTVYTVPANNAVDFEFATGPPPVSTASVVIIVVEQKEI